MEDDYIEVELTIVMNEDGEYAVSHDADTAIDAFNDDYSGVREITHVTIRKRAPKIIEVSATMPDNGATDFTMTITEAK